MWIVTDSSLDIAADVERIGSLERAAVISASAPAESLLFLSNELFSNPDESQREHPRILYGTTVLFREAGTDTDNLGFTYNVSLSGLFIRTLAPPTASSIWLELCAPGTSRLVRLEGMVAWTHIGPPSAAVESVERFTEPAQGLTGFDVLD